MFGSILNMIYNPVYRSNNNVHLTLEFSKEILSEQNYIWNEEDFFKNQMDQLSNYLLINDYTPHVPINTYSGLIKSTFKWLNKGEIIAGSFATMCIKDLLSIASSIIANDIDIYFKSRDDASEFAKLNNIYIPATTHPMCFYGSYGGGTDAVKVNLIFGIPYASPDDLISKFDIRVCSIAIDPNNHKVHIVSGAVKDIYSNKIVYNPVPRAVSINRLLRYSKKGLEMDPHQRLFFAELVRSNLYSPELELVTGGY